MVTALLLHQEIKVKSHTGAIQQFAFHFVKTEILPQVLQEHLIFCFQKRQKGDYDLYSDILEDEAKESVLRAREFVQIASDFLLER